MPEFDGDNTTTELLTRHIFDRLADAARDGELGRDGKSSRRSGSRIGESHVARAWYEAPLWPRRVAFAVPGDIDDATGGYGYDRRMIAELRGSAGT